MKKCLTTLKDVNFDEASEQALAHYAKALAHPARIRILKILSGGQCLGFDLVEQLGLAQSTISEHLKVLRKAGLVKAEVQHPRTCFSLKAEAMVQIKALLRYISN